MRKMAKGTRARWLARVVCLLFVAPLLAMGPAAQRAAAQEVTTTFKIIPVAVLDFVNKTPYQAGILGRTAADAVVVALDGSGRFEPLQRDQVKRALQELGLRVPLNYVAQQRLGKHLEVAGVISGEVREVALVPRPEGQTARVTLAVVMVDVATGEPVNGALVAASSSPKPGYSADRDVLINEALRMAAFEVVQAMLSYQAPQVMVHSADPNHAFLKGGSRQGLRDGMEMVVLRFGEKVGRIRLSQVEASTATADILDNLRGITIGDKAVGVYRLPKQPLPPHVRLEKRERSRRIKHGMSGVLALAAAAAIFLTMSKRKSPAEQVTRGVQASSLANTVNYAELAFAFFPTGATLVTWQAPSRDLLHILGFWIHRNGQRYWFNQVHRGYYFIDPITMMDMGDSTLPMELTLEIIIDSTTGLLEEFTFTTEEPEEEEEGEGEGEGEEMPPAIAYQPTNWGTDLIITWITMPPISGETYTYDVTTLTTMQVIGAGGGGGGVGEGEGEGEAMPPAHARRASQADRSWIMFENQTPGVSGPATCIFPPPLVSPIDGMQVTDLSSVDFTFLSTPGADDYLLQVSRSSQFLPADTVEYDVIGGFFAPFTQRRRVVTDLANMLPPPPGGGALHWRIGARNAGDELPPRVTPGLETSKSHDIGHVWGMPGTFLVGGATLAPPEAPRGTPRPRKRGDERGSSRPRAH